MRLSSRLSAAAMVAITGLTLTVTATAAAAPIPGKHAVARGAATAASGGGAEVQGTAGGTRLWASRDLSTYTGFAFSIAVSPDGSKVFVTGYLMTPAPSRPIMVTVAYNS